MGNGFFVEERLIEATPNKIIYHIVRNNVKKLQRNIDILKSTIFRNCLTCMSLRRKLYFVS